MSYPLTTVAEKRKQSNYNKFMHKNKYVYVVYLILLFFFFSCGQLGVKISSQEGKKLATSRGKNIKSGPGVNAPNGFLNKKKLIEDISDCNVPKVQIKLNIIKDLINKGLNNKSLEVSLASLLRTINEQDEKGYTLFHHTLKSDEARLASLLRTMNEQGKKSYTLFHHTLKSDEARLASLLRSINEQDKDGYTLFHHTLKSDEARLVSILRTINEQDKKGYTLVQYTLKSDTVNPDTVKTSFFLHLPMLELLLSYKFIDIKAADSGGKTILHWAVSSGNLQVVDLILKFAKSRFLPQDYQAYKDFINMKTKIAQDGSGGCSAIYWAISPISLPTDKLESSLEIFKLLLDISEINGTDNQGYTLGHWAVVQGRNDIFKLLIKYGADFSIQDKKGRTVFHLAIETIKDTMHSNLDLANHLIDQEDSILDQLVSLPPYRQEWDKKDHNGYSPLALLSDELELTLEDIKDWKQEKNKQIQTNKRPHIESTEVENCLRFNKKKRGS
ncbi:ankyrin repeat domain-containing protein [Candidatus Cardinium hertigii]|uniref:ankyrin repeat domain-containing protein n=1 Tax=Candidatus Cardinium hertigii TaxID=247481 RepID=UPI001FA9B3EF|nr:ankyrin repeat domain-containing protein [Candidatus Cardinium hertigii]